MACQVGDRGFSCIPREEGLARARCTQSFVRVSGRSPRGRERLTASTEDERGRHATEVQRQPQSMRVDRREIVTAPVNIGRGLPREISSKAGQPSRHRADLQLLVPEHFNEKSP